MKTRKRYRLYLFNLVTNERKEALAKHADMLNDYESRAILKRTKGQMGIWEYRRELINTNPHSA